MIKQKKKVLFLTLHKEWFNQIAAGVKTTEYRELKDYWVERLCGSEGIGSFKKYDEVHFRNGYAKNAPFMRVEFKGTAIEKDTEYGDRYFAIKLGKVLELKNTNLSI